MSLSGGTTLGFSLLLSIRARLTHDLASRPDYAKLGSVRSKFPETPVMALTATVTRQALTDAKRSLAMTNCFTCVEPSDRQNLHFAVEDLSGKPPRECHQRVIDFIKTNPIAKGGKACGIVYCMTHKDTEELGHKLKQAGISAYHYHAGQTPSERKVVQCCWQKGIINVVCATIAYGNVSTTHA